MSFNTYFAHTVNRTSGELATMRNTLVPGLMFSLRTSQSYALGNESRKEVPRFNVTEDMMSTYRGLLSKAGPSAHDVPKEDLAELWDFLDQAVREQYLGLIMTPDPDDSVVMISDDDDASSSLSSAPEDNPNGGETVKLEDEIDQGDASGTTTYVRKHETISKHADETRMATFPITLPSNGAEFDESEILPTERAGVTEGAATYVIPNPADHKVPRHTDKRWIQDKTRILTWTRGEEIWTARIFYRIFRVDTDRYCGNYLADYKTGIDPNEADWKNKYNKALTQVLSRHQTDHQKRSRVPWSQAERHALYCSINRWCEENGVDAFIPEDISTLGRQMTTELNTAFHGENRDSSRSVDAVRSQIQHAVNGTSVSNPLITQMAKRAAVLRERISNGVDISNHERYSTHAIDVPDVP